MNRLVKKEAFIMKEKYESAEIETVEFQAEDVILTSGEDPKEMPVN